MIIYAGGTPDHPNVQASFTTYHTTQGMLSDRFKYWLTLVQQERPVPPFTKLGHERSGSRDFHLGTDRSITPFHVSLLFVRRQIVRHDYSRTSSARWRLKFPVGTNPSLSQIRQSRQHNALAAPETSHTQK